MRNKINKSRVAVARPHYNTIALVFIYAPREKAEWMDLIGTVKISPLGEDPADSVAVIPTRKMHFKSFKFS